MARYISQPLFRKVWNTRSHSRSERRMEGTKWTSSLVRQESKIQGRNLPFKRRKMDNFSMDACNWKNAKLTKLLQRYIGRVVLQRQGRRRIQSSVHRARQLQQRQDYLTLISKLSSYGWRRKWRSFRVLSGHDDRSSQIVTVAWWRRSRDRHGSVHDKDQQLGIKMTIL